MSQLQRALPKARKALALALLVWGCAPPNAAVPYPSNEPKAKPQVPQPAPVEAPKPPIVAEYFGRSIPLEPFISGFPHPTWFESLGSQELFALRVGATYELVRFEVSDVLAKPMPLNLASAQRISDADWSKRSLWSVHHPRARDELWLHADAKNDERMNLWVLDPRTRKLEAVTDHDYVYSLGFGVDDTLVAYLPRTGTRAPYRTCLHVMDVASRNAREIVCDQPQLRFTWGKPRFSADGSSVYFNAQIDGDRNRVQIVRVRLDVAAPRLEIVTDVRHKRTRAALLEQQPDPDTWLFLANDDGFMNLYAYSIARGQTRQLTRLREDLSEAQSTTRGVLGVHGTPAGSTLVRIDAQSGALTTVARWPGKARILGAHEDRAIVTHEAPDVVFEAFTVPVVAGEPRRIVELTPELSAAIVQCKATPVRIPTFDRDPITKKQRELHAFLLEPKQPWSDAASAASTGETVPSEIPRLGLVRAFYGGDNGYDTYDQLLCAAGLTVLSPSVRGSAGFGKAFAALNDADLGGNEIRDLFAAASWLQRHTGLPTARIGVYGRSHGGYATLRALTFESTAKAPVFAFGFGIAEAAFADILAFHASTNIPDWVVLEAGDPAVARDRARIESRSPMNQVERLRAPVLLLHGAADWRVPVEQSREFVQRARARGKPVSYVEFDGQGHHVEGLELQARAWQARFDFLMAVARALPVGPHP